METNSETYLFWSSFPLDIKRRLPNNCSYQRWNGCPEEVVNAPLLDFSRDVGEEVLPLLRVLPVLNSTVLLLVIYIFVQMALFM